jgi:hypothetical protein
VELFVFIMSFAGLTLLALVGIYKLGDRNGWSNGFAAGSALVRHEAKAAEDAADAFPESEEEDEDVCLRPGQRVVCNLSDRTHTHGIILGFTIGAHADGTTMLAIVDLGNGAPTMPIDVDRIDPVDVGSDDGSGPGVTYRESGRNDPANPKQWN